MNALLFDEIKSEIRNIAPDKIFIITDSNVADIETKLIEALSADYSARVIIIPAGEENKSIGTLERILMALSAGEATRRSMLICIGGGMVTDIGGFAAAIFKRGIRHINVATTILAAVDAAVGGKTGIDFAGLKNEIGAFHLPCASLFDAESFASLPDGELLSGFGEVIKTALIADNAMTERLLQINPLEADARQLHEICTFCRDEKMRVVGIDPTEKGLRKVLNMGHTAGHAMESLALEKGRGVAHGVAIAHGNLVALILSNMLIGLEASDVSAYAHWLRAYYPAMPITCADYDRLWQIASHDKKNRDNGLLAYTLVAPIGTPHFDIAVDRTQFEEALDIYQELQGR